MNKKGWIKIFEVAVASLLIVGAVLVILDKKYSRIDISGDVYGLEVSTLRYIQLNNSFRNNILGIPAIFLPVNWSDFNSNGLESLRTYIKLKTPNYLNCSAKLCAIDQVCVQDEIIPKEIFVEQVVISANLTTYSPRQLKMFCWEN